MIAFKSEQAQRGLRFWDDYYDRGASDVDDRLDTNSLEKEWICTIADILPFIPFQFIEQTNEFVDVLEIGCGESCLIESFYDYFYEKGSGRHFLAVDISKTAIDRFKARCIQQSRFRLFPTVADATDMFDLCEDSTRCVILDKGTSDTLQFRAKSRDSDHLLRALFSEVYRILSADGVYIVISPRRKIKFLATMLPWRKITRERISRGGQSLLIHKQSYLNDILSGVKVDEHACWIHICYKGLYQASSNSHGIKDVEQHSLPASTEGQIKNVRFSRTQKRSSLCYSWISNGECQYGSQCRFEHCNPDQSHASVAVCSETYDDEPSSCK